jgi:hypothetical protein
MSDGLPFCMRCGTRHLGECGVEARESLPQTRAPFGTRRQLDVDLEEQAALRRYLAQRAGWWRRGFRQP